MLAVIFEVTPTAEGEAEYLATAAALKLLLAEIEGFLGIERFASLSEPGKILSLSFWRDEAAIAQWRQLEAHRFAQQLGRQQLFVDYRLRVATVVRDYGMTPRDEAPVDSRAHHSG